MGITNEENIAYKLWELYYKYNNMIFIEILYTIIYVILICFVMCIE